MSYDVRKEKVAYNNYRTAQDYAGLDGIVIADATRDGSSSAYDIRKPRDFVVYLTDKAGGPCILIRAEEVEKYNHVMQQLIAKNRKIYSDTKTAAIETYKEFDAEMQKLRNSPNVQPTQVQTEEPAKVKKEASSEVRHLMAEATKAVTPPVPAVQPRKVTFELPGAGQIATYYHQVIRAESALILVLDTSRKDSPRYTPPVLEDEDGNPKSFAALVEGENGQQDVLYLVYYSGTTFKFQHYEFSILIVDRERFMEE